MDHARLPERLYGLEIVPAAVRPGTMTTVRLTLRNRGTVASPPARVRFLLPDALDALDALETEIAPVAPDGVTTAACRVRVADGARDGEPLVVQAAVRYDGGELGSNVATAVVRAEPELDGSGTSAAVCDDGNGNLVLELVVANTGDGAAGDVVASIPPQPGLALAEPATLALGTIAPGEARSATATLPLGACGDGGIVVDGIALHDAAGRATVLAPCAATVVPRWRTPELAVGDDGARVAVAIVLAPDGPVHIGTAEVRITLPAGLKLAAYATRVDGIPVGGGRARSPRNAVLRTTADGAVVTLARVAAGRTTNVTFEAFRTGAGRGRLRVEVSGAGDAHVLETAVEAPPPPAPIATLLASPRRIDGMTTLLLSLTHAGLEPATLRVTHDGRTLFASPFASGEMRELDLAVETPAGERIDLRVESAGAAALLTVALPATPATTAVPDVHAAETSGTIAATAALDAPAHAVAGGTFDAAVTITTHRDVGDLVVRIPDDAFAYVVGTASVDGHAVLDASRPILSDGLHLRAVPAGTTTVVRWRAVARAAAGSAPLRAVVSADGTEIAVAPRDVLLAAPDVFGARPDGLAFHVDAPLAAAMPLPAPPPPTVAPPPPPALPAVSFGNAFGPARAAEALRLLDGGAIDGLVAHVLALRVLLPDGADDARVAGALGLLRDAVRDVLDRLFVKIRIPAYDVTGADCEDGRARAALCGVLDELAATSLWNDDLAVRRRLLDVVPFGDAAALATLAAIVPSEAPAADYAAAIRDALDAFDRRPPGAFDAALARERDPMLDSARTRFTFALITRAEVPR